MAEVARKRSFDGDGHAQARKKFKLSDLPISQSKKAAIDHLTTTFRKSGEFDKMRKSLFEQFDSSPAKDNLLSALDQLVDRETDRDHSLLSKDPRISATLIEGAAERSDIYRDVAATVSGLIDKLFDTEGIEKMRENRIKEVGPKAAAEEEARGSKTEDDYAREAEGRRQVRVAAREKEMERRRQQEKEEQAAKEAKRAERRRLEEEKKEARRKADLEREERRRKEQEEREKEEEERRRQDRERIEREREERRRAREDRDRRRPRYSRSRSRSRARSPDRSHLRDRSRSRPRYRSRTRTPVRGRDRDRGRRRTRSRSRTPPPAKPVSVDDIKIDDDAAMEALLKETEDLKKSRQRPALERSESLEPPMRKAQPPKSLVPRDPIAARLAKTETRSQSPVRKSGAKTPVPTIEDSPSKRRGSDVHKTDDRVSASADKRSSSRFDLPPPAKRESIRGRSKSRSPGRRSPSNRSRRHSRSRSRGSHYGGRRPSRREDDRYSRDDRMSYRPANDRRRDRDEKPARRESRSPSRETYSSHRKAGRSPSRDRRTRDRRRSPSPARSRSRDRRYRDYSPRRGSRRHHSRSRSRDVIDRYIPGGRGKGVDPRDETPPRDKERDRGFRTREYERRGNTRRQESDCYNPNQGRARDRSRDGSRDRARDRDRSRDRGRDKDDRRDRDTGREKRRRERSPSRSRSRSRARR